MSLTRMAHTAADSLGVMLEEEEVGDVTRGRADSTLSTTSPTPDLYTRQPILQPAPGRFTQSTGNMNF